MDPAALDTETQFYSSINYQKMLGISECEAVNLAKRNVLMRNAMDSKLFKKAIRVKNHFSNHFINSTALVNFFSNTNLSNDPVIFALFHFGDHINIPLDLALAGLPVTIPVAGEPFELLYSNKEKYSEAFGSNLELLQVENSTTAKSMLKAMKNNRHMCIYVDGNIAQDGVHVAKSAVEVTFFDFKIRVKNTISKLSQKYKLNVVPLFAELTNDGYPIISMGEQLAPSTPNMLQSLYSELEAKVFKHPEKWFYVQCLHRWVVPENIDNSDTRFEDYNTLVLNHRIARLFQKGNSWFIVNYKTQRAVLIEDSLKDQVIEPCRHQLKADFIHSLAMNLSTAGERFISSLIKENLLCLPSQI